MLDMNDRRRLFFTTSIYLKIHWVCKSMTIEERDIEGTIKIDTSEMAPQVVASKVLEVV